VIHETFEPWVNPIFRWAGSKRKLIPALTRRIPSKFTNYFEPFAGSACLFFAIRPKRAVLGDINEQLITAYQMILAHPRIVARQASDIPPTPESYYQIRSNLPNETASLTRAIYFVFLNRHCFNGVYRTNKKGHFNVPFGRCTGAMPDARHFFRCSLALRSAILLCSDYSETLSKVRKNDFVYLDPPYSSCDRPRYGEYGYDSFQPLDVSNLAKSLKEIHRRGAKFMLSYADSRAARKEFAKFRIEVLEVRRHIAGFARHRNYVKELIVSNYAKYGT
jgi:DNA adenine methylase